MKQCSARAATPTLRSGSSGSPSPAKPRRISVSSSPSGNRTLSPGSARSRACSRDASSGAHA
eukprot:15330142-Alexandrium_andersonii.AAC.1